MFCQLLVRAPLDELDPWCPETALIGHSGVSGWMSSDRYDAEAWNGLLAGPARVGAIDDDSFVDSVEQRAAELRPDDAVLLGDFGSHEANGLRIMTDEDGAQRLHLPSDSAA